VGKWRETHFVNNKEKEKWIEDYVDRETAEARKRVEDAETAITQEQDDMRNAETAGLTTTNSKTTCEEMLNAIWDRPSDVASSDEGEEAEDEVVVEEDPEQGDLSDDPELGNLREDHEPGWVMRTISTTVHHRM